MGQIKKMVAHHNIPLEQQRWYAVKIFERDEKVLEQLKLDKTILDCIEQNIKTIEVN